MSDLWSDFYETPQTPEPEPSTVGPTPETESDSIIVTVLASLDGGQSCLVRTLAGREILVKNTLFPHLRRGDKLGAFRTEDGWSFAHPRWQAWRLTLFQKMVEGGVAELERLLNELFPGEKIDYHRLLDSNQASKLLKHLNQKTDIWKARLTFAARVKFEFVAPNACNPDLWNGFIGKGKQKVPAAIRLIPGHLKFYSSSELIGTTIHAFIADSTVRPILVAPFISWMKHKSQEQDKILPVDCKEQFQHLAFLADKLRRVEARVHAANDQVYYLTVLGIPNIPLPRYELSWKSEHQSTLEIGAQISIRLHSDLETARLWASLRDADPQAWREVRSRFQIGTMCTGLLRQSDVHSRTYEISVPGFHARGVFRLNFDDSDILPFSAPPYGDGDQCVTNPSDEERLAKGRQLLISGYNDADCALELSPIPFMRESYSLTADRLIPVRVVSVKQETTSVTWSPEDLVVDIRTLNGQEALKDETRLARTTLAPPQGNTPELRLLPSICQWEVIGFNTGEITIRSVSENLLLTVPEPKNLGSWKPGELIWLNFSSVCFKPSGAELQSIRCADSTILKIGSTVKGVVKSVVKGGLIVNISFKAWTPCGLINMHLSSQHLTTQAGVKAFLPGSQMDIVPPKDLQQFVGNTYDFKIVKINSDRKNVVLSRRELIKQECSEKRQRFLDTIKIGSTVKGVVKNLIDFGALIDLDGMDGLLHITDMSWGRLDHPSEMVKVGQEIDVQVLDINRDKERVSLGLKQTQKNPWEETENRFPIGARVKGKITNLVPYGAFVQIEEGVEGLVHVSELSWTKRITRPSDVLTVGQDIEAIVLGINKEEQKISLGVRQLEPNPWDEIEHRFPIGARVKGKITNLVPYGAFVQIEEGVEGLVHVSELSWTKRITRLFQTRPSDVLTVGQDIEAIVLGINKEEQKISLGVRQFEPNPWDEIEHRFPIGARVKRKITNLAPYGAFVELEEGIDGMIHVSDMSWTRKINHPSEMVKKGDELEAVVIDIDKQNQRIDLGMKQLEGDPWKEIEDKYKIGDLVKGKVSKITAFGAFISMDGDIDGLVHISQISEDRVDKIKDHLKIGQEIEARVINVDKAERRIGRIGLSLKAVNYSEEDIKREAAAFSEIRIPLFNSTPAMATVSRSGGDLLFSSPHAVPEDPPLVSEPCPPAEPPHSVPIQAPATVKQSTADTQFQTLPKALVSKASECPRPTGTADGTHASILEEEGAALFSRWLNGLEDASLSEWLSDCGWQAIGSLVAKASGIISDRKPWPTVPSWARLNALLPCDDGSSGVAHMDQLEAVLRALAGHPDEPALSIALIDLLPLPFIRERWQLLGDWLKQMAPNRDAESGLALLRATAEERAGNAEEAFTIANAITPKISDASLRGWLGALLKKQEEQLLMSPRFYDKYRRIFSESTRIGGFAHVFPVEAPNGERLALKRLRPRLLAPVEMERISDLFRREAQILAKVTHPNIVSFRGEPGPNAVLLEWLDGRPLSPTCEGGEGGRFTGLVGDGIGDREGWWNLPRVIACGRQVASAMQHLQSIFGTFVHNDLTPRNLMINQRIGTEAHTPWIKLIDFGLASAPEFSSISSVIDEAGVRLREVYRAPEVRHGVFHQPASDMFSLGVILFQLITRRYPLSQAAIENGWNAQAQAPESVRKLVPSALADLLLRLLSPAANSRPENWQVIVEILSQLEASTAL